MSACVTVGMPTKTVMCALTLMSVQTVPIHVLKMQIVQTPKEATHATVKTASKTKVVTEETAPTSTSA